MQDACGRLSRSDLPSKMSDFERIRQESLALGASLACHCAPAFILPSLGATSEEIINSGTLTLVETPRRQLFVTAYHVWKEFTQRRMADPAVVFGTYLGPGYNCIALTEVEYLDGDETVLDIAILHAPRAGYI